MNSTVDTLENSENLESIFQWFYDQKIYKLVEQRVQFKEELTIYHRFNGLRIGKKIIDISSEFNEKTRQFSYIVKVVAEWKIDIIENGNLVTKTKVETLEAKILPNLVTESQKSESKIDGEINNWLFYEFTDDSGIIVKGIDGDPNTENLKYIIFPSDVKLLLSEGASYVLLRLSALYSRLGRTRFMTTGPKSLVKGNIFFDQVVDTSDEADCKTLEEKPKKKTNIGSFVQFSLIAFNNSKIRDVKNLFDFNFISNLEFDCFLNEHGKILKMEFKNSNYWCKKEYERGVVAKNETDPLKSRTFNNNIEFISEYKSTKEEITFSHKDYIAKHPELYDTMSDYLQLLLHRKPHDVYNFTINYFGNTIEKE